jgi:hypothetical protein
MRSDHSGALPNPKQGNRDDLPPHATAQTKNGMARAKRVGCAGTRRRWRAHRQGRSRRGDEGVVQGNPEEGDGNASENAEPQPCRFPLPAREGAAPQLEATISRFPHCFWPSSCRRCASPKLACAHLPALLMDRAQDINPDYRTGAIYDYQERKKEYLVLSFPNTLPYYSNDAPGSRVHIGKNLQIDRDQPIYECPFHHHPLALATDVQPLRNVSHHWDAPKGVR